MSKTAVAVPLKARECIIAVQQKTYSLHWRSAGTYNVCYASRPEITAGNMFGLNRWTYVTQNSLAQHFSHPVMKPQQAKATAEKPCG
jgi:hypothetical protein